MEHWSDNLKKSRKNKKLIDKICTAENWIYQYEWCYNNAVNTIEQDSWYEKIVKEQKILENLISQLEKTRKNSYK